ncbi:MAG TPA: DNA topoisomerase I [Cryomorphaceae bacterium]|nr:DNA topoisomerase I [Owenweeksia sp.]HAD97952.1 DNA topoisomerase I [Cryomorphaceae bacterium]HBF18471.1 DNA topoisomerase I [Cryomorphaceae bacterium]HCQ15640.1 DNA topoisomerase I [Cryomorphaceae bacterium]|tara:strand:+ start:3451 stop:4461 length:1011 start_codon:yes stop_codon:yes gene_type:complete
MTDSIPEHLVRVQPDQLNITRKKWGRGYRYYNGGEMPLEDEGKLEVVSSIPVPATWSEVHLCPDPQSYILASGYDGSGKFQYLYHPDYLDFRNKLKFEELHHFGEALPRIRRKVRADLKAKEWTEEKLMALLVRVLDKYHLRIGSRVYAQKNQSFGLTTLRKKHLKEEDSDMYFQYQGKSGQLREVHLTDSRLVDLIHEVAEFPGWELFSFRQGNASVSASSTKVNHYIQDISQSDFTARTFRTWAGTVLAVKYYPKAKDELKANPRRDLKAILVEKVAEKLGNTPAVCRDYYIHPGVLEKVVSGNFDPNPCDQQFLKNNLYRKYECRTMEILSGL